MPIKDINNNLIVFSTVCENIFWPMDFTIEMCFFIAVLLMFHKKKAEKKDEIGKSEL